MRIPYLIARFLTGALFVFSGIVKLNDPSGFGIKLNEYFDVFAQDLATPQDSMRLVVYSGGQKLIDQKTVLYSFDREKEMVLEARGVEEEGDLGPISPFQRVSQWMFLLMQNPTASSSIFSNGLRITAYT